MDKKTNGGFPGVFIVGRILILFLGLCLGLSANAEDKNVKILFDGPGPVGVDPSDPIDLSKISKGKIYWSAYNRDGSAEVDENYEIFFDPFVGKSFTSRDGKVTSQPVAKKVPENVDFKYTVVGDDCADKPLDPTIRVRR